VNHYETLGVSPGAGAGTIRRAYLAAARQHHPDFHADAPSAVRVDNARRMQQLNEAWAVVGNPDNRSAYDLQLRRSLDPGVARRAGREPGAAPPGKGWTPRADDTGWMDDFGAWAGEDDVMAPDVPRSTGRRVLMLVPVALFAGSVGSVAMGGILTSRALLALGVILFAMSVAMFFLLPVLEMTRNRHRH